jgi:hypothetical protein
VQKADIPKSHTQKKYLGFTKFRDQDAPRSSALALASLHIADISSLINKKERARTKEQSVARTHIYSFSRGLVDLTLRVFDDAPWDVRHGGR